MRIVKDQLTGEKKPNTELWQAPNKKYYTSKEAYEIYESSNEYRIKTINLAMDILGYKDGMKLPTLFYKKVKEWEVYGNDVIYNTLNAQCQNIEWAIKNKQFNGEVAKVMYISAIIQNHIMDEYKKKVIENKRKVIEKRNETSIETTNIDNVGKTSKGRDVSNLLGDDLWN